MGKVSSNGREDPNLSLILLEAEQSNSAKSRAIKRNNRVFHPIGNPTRERSIFLTGESISPSMSHRIASRDHLPNSLFPSL
jgi:hypothetical protein